ncbi:MAG: energy transducer TonB [Bacteroidales bacterium]|nr:energy transducer TonB [Bacteroidales bacterium]
MEVKKTKQADLEKKRILFLEIGLVVVLAIVLAAFEWSTRPQEQNIFNVASEDVGDEEQIPITRPQDQPPPPPPAPPQVFELNIVEDDVELDDQLELANMDADVNQEVQFVEFNEEEEEEVAFIIVEDMPTFQGGDQNTFRTWIQQNLKYPEIAAENGISGKVYVNFVVNREGNVVDAKVVRGVDPSLDQEALRVVRSSPKWSPGKQRGKPVKVQFTFPIVFVLQ